MKRHYSTGITAFTKCGLETFSMYSSRLTSDKNKATCKRCLKSLKPIKS